MEPYKTIRLKILEIVDIHLREENVPESMEALNRLIQSGFSKTRAKNYIVNVLRLRYSM